MTKNRVLFLCSEQQRMAVGFLCIETGKPVTTQGSPQSGNEWPDISRHTYWRWKCFYVILCSLPTVTRVITRQTHYLHTMHHEGFESKLENKRETVVLVLGRYCYQKMSKQQTNYLGYPADIRNRRCNPTDTRTHLFGLTPVRSIRSTVTWKSLLRPCKAFLLRITIMEKCPLTTDNLRATRSSTNYDFIHNRHHAHVPRVPNVTSTNVRSTVLIYVRECGCACARMRVCSFLWQPHISFHTIGILRPEHRRIFFNNSQLLKWSVNCCFSWSPKFHWRIHKQHSSTLFWTRWTFISSEWSLQFRFSTQNSASISSPPYVS
jgi:hypothetical protein